MESVFVLIVLVAVKVIAKVALTIVKGAMGVKEDQKVKV